MRIVRVPVRRGLWLALACILLTAGVALAQSAGGAIEGRITDGQGAAVAGAVVTATNTATGITRSVQSDVDGRYSLASLPVGTYDIVVTADGYRDVEARGIAVQVASTRTLDVRTDLSTVEEAIVVTAEAVPLLPDSPAIGTVVTQNEIENLPLNGRQFANLGALAPGTQLAYNSDPTKPGQLTIALNGGIGRNVNFTIDGGDNTDDTIGGALQNFNLEAVQEFKVQTMLYKAEYGRSSGGVLSVVTKTGTNRLAGSAWGFFRDDELNSQTESEKLAGIDKQAYERQQYGLAVGGPIVQDRAHFFATYERTDRETNYVVDSGGIFPDLDGNVVALPFEDELFTAKATWDVSPKQYVQVRYGMQENADKYGQSALPAPNNLGTVANEYQSVLASHTWQAGSSALNEFVFQYSTFENLISADSNLPLLIFPNGFTFGQNLNAPQSTNQTKYQYKDDFSWATNLFGMRNEFKVGAQYVHEPELGGDFSTGLSGQFTLLENRVGSPVTEIVVFGGFFGDDTPIDQYSGYLQDDIYVNDNLTVSVGLRYDYWDGFDLDQRSNPIWQTLSTQTRYDEYYLRDFRGGGGGVLENDDDNFAPRIGFLYDLKGDGRHLIRGGYGTYYDFPYTNATILFPAAAVQSNYGILFFTSDENGIRNPNGTFWQPGQPLPGTPALEPDVPNEVASPTLATPYSDQWSLGYAVQVNEWLGLDLSVVSVDYHDIPYRFRANPIDPTTGRRRFTEGGIANFRLWYGGGRATYEGANLGVRMRHGNFDLQGFYTYSESEGNVLAGADEFRLTDSGHQADINAGGRDVSVNPLDPQCGRCFGPLNTDARHKATFGATWNGPWGLNLSGMLRYRSALPYTDFLLQDANGDGFRLELKPGDSVNSERGDSFTQFDVRVGKEFTFGDFGLELIAEVFNVFNEENPARFDRFGEPHAYAGDPAQGEQRLGQLGVRIRFR